MCVCVCVCVCVCGVCVCVCVWRPIISTKTIAFAMIHHLSTALFALQHSLDIPPLAAVSPSQQQQQDFTQTREVPTNWNAPIEKQKASR